MNAQYCSDLHLEFAQNKQYILDNPILACTDILILAGDIVPFAQMDKYNDFFDDIAHKFKFVYWVAGNHEFYNSDMASKTGVVREEIRKNVFLVNNTWVNHGSTRFVFSTLWTKISDENKWKIQDSLNDFHLIKNEGKKLTAKMYNKLFDENLAFIKQAVENNISQNCVVVTHHVPTFNNYPPEYLGSSINEAFAVDLSTFIENHNIDFWIYGHHHRNIADFKIGNTTLLTNQLGYVHNNEHLTFNQSKCFKI